MGWDGVEVGVEKWDRLGCMARLYTPLAAPEYQIV